MFGKKLVTICFLVITFSLTTQLVCHGAIFNVFDVAGFRQALIDASNNTEDDTINVAAGTYSISTNGGDLNYYPGQFGFGSDNHALIIQGAGTGSTILDGGTGGILRISTSSIADDSSAHITIRDLTFQNAYQALHVSVGYTGSPDTPDILLENSEFLNNTGWSGAGAGISLSDADGNVTVTNNTFANNSAAREAGGLYVLNSGSGTALVTDNTFSNNSAVENGGGAYVHSTYGDTILDNNIFDLNIAGSSYGGGTFAQSHYGTVTLSNNTFTNNSNTYTYGSGGGATARSDNGPVVILEKNFFKGNSSAYMGGGASVFSASSANLALNDNVFEENTAALEGGGVYASTSQGDVLFTNNVCFGNTAATGGGVYARVYANTAPGEPAEIFFTNNTIVANSATDGGGAVVSPQYDGYSAAHVYNNILWGNSATGNGADLYILDDFATFGTPDAGTPVTVSNNNFSGYYGYCESTAGCAPNVSKSNNINIDPNLTDLTADGSTPEYDYHLQAGSPCIDAGDSGAPGLPVLDFDDGPRVMGTLPDIGADEYPFPTTTYYCDDDADGYIDVDPDGTCGIVNCEPAGCDTSPGDDCDDGNNLVNPAGSETCDGLDNDCDGTSDEDFANLNDPCSAGVGECSATGSYVCTADETGTECNAVPGSPTTEVCDGLDNDCDGTADETFVDLGNTCSVGIGICSAAGNYVCTVDETGTECDAVPGSPTTELCDGLDNDCDGIADEDFGNLGNACTVGVGVCSAAGNYVCTADQANTECDATPGSPTTELCDGLDNDCDGATDEGCGAATITAWHIETVDYAGFVGTYTSIALDPSGNPHVSYMDYSNRGLKYAYYDGSIWNIETVDAVGDVGYYTSIALDPSGNPHISYFDNSNLDMKYAYYNGSVWNIETVDAAAVFGYKSMVLDPTGNPHVSYRDYSNQGLKYAYYDGSVWHIETVDAAYDVGYSTSIALDPSGNPHISYFDNSNRDLKYAYFDGSIWNIETVDYIGMGWHGWHASIALDSLGNPHISYLDAYPSQDLKYAYYDGSIWNIETVDAVGGDNGFFTSTALDPSGNPHISYLDGYPIRDLKYAYYDGSIWNIETVDSAGDVGWHSSMVLDPTGNPHVSYLDFSNLNLKYAYKEEVGISDSATVSTSEGDMTVSISEGSFAVAPAIVAPGFGIPDGFLTPYGALSYTISTDPGATVTVIVTLPEEPPPGTTLFKCINSVCSPIVGAIISGYNGVFDVTDGGSLDEDTIVNGEIVEPCVLAVPAHPEVAIDIKPGSCPNLLNIKSKGVLPAAIIGTEDFDVTRIDPASINLMGIAPLRWSLKDVATPYEPFTGKEEATDCADAGPDGLADLTLKFDTQELVQAFELLLGVNLEDGETLVVRLTGNLREEYGSAQFIGEDVVVILKKNGKKKK